MNDTGSPKRREDLNSEPSFQQVPYQVLLQRVDSGSQSLFELTNIIIERRELEEKCALHAARVSRMNIFEHEVRDSTSEKVLGLFKNYHLYLSKAQTKYHKEFGDSVLRDLEDLKIGRAAVINKSKVTVQNCQRDVSSAEDALEKAKKNFQRVQQEHQRSLEKLASIEQHVVEYTKMLEERKRESAGKDGNKYTVSRMLISAFESTPEQDKDKQTKKVTRKLEEMKTATKQIADRKRELLDRINALDIALSKATKAFQDAEWDRISKTKSCLKNFCLIERSLIEARINHLQGLEEAIAGQSAEVDIAMFISQAKQSEHTHKYAHALQLLDLQMERFSKELSARTESHSRAQERRSGSQIAESRILLSAYNASANASSAVEGLDSAVNNRHFAVDEYSGSSSFNSDMLNLDEEPAIRDTSNSSLEINFSNFFDKNIIFSLSSLAQATGTDYDVNNADLHNSNKDDLTDPVAKIPAENVRETSLVAPRFSADELAVLNQMNNALFTLFPIEGAINSYSHLEVPDKNSKQGDLSLHPLTTLDGSPEISVDKWSELLKSEPAREMFLQELDEQRGRRANLSGTAFRSMGNAMKAFLDYCETNNDVKSAMRIKNMANTFYSLEDTSRPSKNEGSPRAAAQSDGDEQINSLLSALLGPSPGSTPLNEAVTVKWEAESPYFRSYSPVNSSSNANSNIDCPIVHYRKEVNPELNGKKYLQGEESFTNHSIWRQQGFWDSALIEGTLAQLAISDNSLSSWDEMSYESLRERVIGVHNVIFGQLGSLAFAMLQSGLTYEEVEGNILSMCLRCQLTEEQRFDLVNNVKVIFGKVPSVSISGSPPLGRKGIEIGYATAVIPFSQQFEVKVYATDKLNRKSSEDAETAEDAVAEDDVTWAVVDCSNGSPLQAESEAAPTLIETQVDKKDAKDMESPSNNSKPIVSQPIKTKSEDKSPSLLSYFSFSGLTGSKSKSSAIKASKQSASPTTIPLVSVESSIVSNPSDSLASDSVQDNQANDISINSNIILGIPREENDDEFMAIL